jgi:hypothetical protein
MTSDERLLALCAGEPVGEACPSYSIMHFPDGVPEGSCVCSTCGGTGRVRTTPEGPVEAWTNKVPIGATVLGFRPTEEHIAALIRAERRRAVRLIDRYCGPLRQRAFVKELKRAILGPRPRRKGEA